MHTFGLRVYHFDPVRRNHSVCCFRVRFSGRLNALLAVWSICSMVPPELRYTCTWDSISSLNRLFGQEVAGSSSGKCLSLSDCSIFALPDFSCDLKLSPDCLCSPVTRIALPAVAQVLLIPCRVHVVTTCPANDVINQIWHW